MYNKDGVILKVMDGLIEKINKPIVFIGMMGCGKSSVGKAFSTRFGLPFYDSDDEVVDVAGRSISDIFETDGEPAFRELEKDTIDKLLNHGACIISVGGGAVTTPAALASIKAQGVSVWLNVDVDALLNRLSGDTSRPLLQATNPSNILNSLLEQRTPLYEQADLCVDVDGRNVDDLVMHIAEELKRIV